MDVLIKAEVAMITLVRGKYFGGVPKCTFAVLITRARKRAG